MESATGGPRYAPVDPTLPPSWRALIDGTTGYVYYWNTETNTTQYEKPSSSSVQSESHKNRITEESKSNVHGNGHTNASSGHLMNGGGSALHNNNPNSNPNSHHPAVPGLNMYSHPSAMHGNGGHMVTGNTVGGMSSGPTHMNTSENTSSYGNGIQTSGGSRGYPVNNGGSVNVAMQPKIAVVPSRQQVSIYCFIIVYCCFLDLNFY